MKIQYVIRYFNVETDNYTSKLRIMLGDDVRKTYYISTKRIDFRLGSKNYKVIK